MELFEKADCVEELFALCNKPGACRLRFRDMEAICRLATRLPEDACLKYPFPYLQIVFILLLSGDQRLMRFARGLYDRMWAFFSSGGHPDREILLGEMLVISRVLGFAMRDDHAEQLENAARLLHGRPSAFLEPSFPLTFGLPMLLHSCFMRASALDNSLARYRVNPFEQVSDGFGQGCVPLMRGEAALLRCDMEQAKLLCRQALAEADEKQQAFVTASALFALMRRALFLGDSAQAADMLHALRERVALAARWLIDNKLSVLMLREVLTLAECFFATALRRTDAIPADFLNGTHRPMMRGGLGVPQVYAARAMLIAGNPMGALRMCQRLDSLPQTGQVTRLEGLIVSALASEAFTGRDSGLPALVTALTEAQRDGVLLPFAEMPELLAPLRRIQPGAGVDTGFLASVIRLCEAYQAVTPGIQTQASAQLSARELEVLNLSAQGKTRKAIGEALGVHEETVKKHLAAAYRKLDAKGKTEAVAKARTLEIL